MIRRAFEAVTGYWIHKASTLPVGCDLRVDLARLGISPAVIFDVGANVGQTYKRFRKDFPSARIYCFEPVASTFQQLQMTIGNDPLTTAERLALGDIEGEATIHTHPQWHVLNSFRVATGSDCETVNVTTVNAYGIVPDLLKIDTEGFELPVLRGAPLDKIGAILCEVGFVKENQRNTYFPEVLEFLTRHSLYALYDVTHYPKGVEPSFANALFIKDSYHPR